MFDWLKNERQKWAASARRSRLRSFTGLRNIDAKTAELYGTALPRGALLGRLDADRERVNYFMSPQELLQHRYRPGQLLLGKFGDTFLGHRDDRPKVTIAAARAGKTSTVLEPNLYLYPGSMLVLDPKAELAGTARYRRAMGHEVHVLDPFDQSGEPTACYNPLDELDPDGLELIDDIASIVIALVPDEGDARSAHWINSARELLLGLILMTLTLAPEERHLVTVRELLCLTYKPLVLDAKVATAKALAEMGKAQKAQYFEINGMALKLMLSKMASLGDRFGGIAAAVGNRFLTMAPTERGSVFSTAAVNTDFIDSLMMRRTLLRSDFSLATLRSGRPATIFLCLPIGRAERHARWLRLIVQLACVILESFGPYPREKPPILFMMEEFATLGHMEIMERAAAYFPGFGVKLWVVLQDINQLQRYYRAGFETFLGNSGLLQFFANDDGETLRYITGRLGKLIEPFELRTAFSRERQSQLLLMQGKPPAAALRLDHADVARIRAHAEARLRGLPSV